MRKFFAIVALVVGVTLVQPVGTANAAFNGTVCVQSTDRAMKWGVRNAIREWNSVEIGPRLVLRNYCRRDRTYIKVAMKNEPWSNGTGVARKQDNGSYHLYFNPSSMWQYPTRRWCVKNHTATHEIGHALGLDHYPNRGDMVMGYGNWWKHCGDIRPADRRLKRNHF